MKRFLISSLLMCFLGSVAVAADKDKIFEIDVSGGVWSGIKTVDASTFSNSQTGALGGNADFLAAEASVNLFVIKAEAEGSYVRYGTEHRFEFSANGTLFPIFYVHDVYIRKGDLDGDETRLMGGFGSSVSLPEGLGSLAAGVGFMTVNWQRPGGPASTIPYAGYAGGTLHLKIWRFQDELRVAYYLAPQFNQDYQGILVNHEQVIKSMQSGFIASNKLYFEAIRLPMTSFGPEVRAQIEQLPDGTEWLATVGFGGRFGL